MTLFNALIRSRKLWLIALALGFTLSLCAQNQDAADAPPAEPAPEAPAAPKLSKSAAKKLREKAKRENRNVIGAVKNRNRHQSVQVGSDVQVGEGDTVPEAVAVMGNAVVDGTVDGDLVVVGGNATINGTVHGNVVVVMGDTILGDKAVLDSDVTVVGGRVIADPGAVINGKKMQFDPGVHMAGGGALGQWMKHGLLLGRPVAPGVALSWLLLGAACALYLLFALILNQPIRKASENIANSTLMAFLIGVLSFILFVPLTLLLVITIVGILALPFVAIGVVFILFIGKTAALVFLGSRLLKQGTLTPFTHTIGSFLVGAIMMALLYCVPLIGIFTWALLTPIGVGGVLILLYKTMNPGMANGNTPASAPFPAAPAPMQTPYAAFTAPNPPGFESTASPIPPLTAPEPPPAATYGNHDFLNLPRAGFWKRFAATFLDLILIGWLMPVSGPFFVLIWSAYHVAFWSWKGTTIGGIVFGLKVVRLDGRPVDGAVALVRSLASVFSMIVFFLGFFWVGWDRNRQSWHDKIAGTTIVKVPHGISLI